MGDVQPFSRITAADLPLFVKQAERLKFFWYLFGFGPGLGTAVSKWFLVFSDLSLDLFQVGHESAGIIVIILYQHTDFFFYEPVPLFANL